MRYINRDISQTSLISFWFRGRIRTTTWIFVSSLLPLIFEISRSEDGILALSFFQSDTEPGPLDRYSMDCKNGPSLLHPDIAWNSTWSPCRTVLKRRNSIQCISIKPSQPWGTATEFYYDSLRTGVFSRARWSGARRWQPSNPGEFFGRRRGRLCSFFEFF